MSRQISREIVTKRMKQTNISIKQIAQYTMLLESDVDKWLKKRKKLPFVCEWQIYHLLSLDEEE